MLSANARFFLQIHDDALQTLNFVFGLVAAHHDLHDSFPRQSDGVSDFAQGFLHIVFCCVKLDQA